MKLHRKNAAQSGSVQQGLKSHSAALHAFKPFIGIGKGHYTGKVNFTMTGDWLLSFDIEDGDETLASDVGLKIFF